MGALATEVARTCESLGLNHTGDWGATPIYGGNTETGDQVIAFQTGVGKVRASAATQYARHRWYVPVLSASC
jgi:hypothetical protein